MHIVSLIFFERMCKFAFSFRNMKEKIGKSVTVLSILMSGAIVFIPIYKNLKK